MYNYDITANIDDSSIIPFIYGCTDSNAYNYDSTVNTDDGSCGYCDLSLNLYVGQNTNSNSCDGCL